MQLLEEMEEQSYLYTDTELSELSTPVYSRSMEWTTIRARYGQLFAEAKKRGETQQTIAARVGLRQNKISELLDNDRKGPNTETFVKAVEGLGLTLSSFFAQIEVLKTSAADGQNDPLRDIKGAFGEPSTVPPPPLTEADRDLYRKIARGFMAAAASTPERNVVKTPRATRVSAKGRRRR